MNKTVRTSSRKIVARGVLIAAMTGGLAFAVAMPASAAPGDTTTTFTLTGGSLTFSVAANAALTDGLAGDASVGGSLGNVVITDDRGTTQGWGVTAASTTFVDGAGSISSGVSYDSGAATAHTGTVTANTAGSTTLTALAVAVASGTAASGNNTATYAPTLTVSLPASALAGDYTGTVTTSVA